jgi:peptidoglycan/xylan/chitin deacetylase (PgdA/CDA1 family)
MAAALFASLLLIAANSTAPVATILCYHEVDPAGPPLHSTIPRRSATGPETAEQLRYTATVENFNAQLDYLEQNGYHVIALGDLVGYLKGERDSLPPRAVVITVDDGWICSYTQVLPALRRRGMPFTLFIDPIAVSHGRHSINWKQIAEMAGAGVDVEGHTFSHPFLTTRNNKVITEETYPQFLEHELLDSKKLIEQKTGKPVRFISYPYGDYDATVIESAARYGYQAAVTTERGPITSATPPMSLKRYLIHNDTTLEEFKTFLLP